MLPLLLVLPPLVFKERNEGIWKGNNKHLTVLAFSVAWWMLIHNRLQDHNATSNSSENVRSGDIAFCIRTAYTEHLLLGLNTSTYQGWFVNDTLLCQVNLAVKELKPASQFITSIMVVVYAYVIRASEVSDLLTFVL